MGRVTSTERATAIEAGVLAAAERLLARGSTFSALTTQQIATEAGVARSTMYLYFKEKDAVLIRLAERLATGAYALVGRWSPQDPGGLDSLTGTLLGVIRHYRAHAPILRAVLEISGQDSAFGQFWDGELTRFIELSRRWLRTEQMAGRTAADLDIDTASQIIVFGGIRVIAAHALDGIPERDEAVARELAVNQWFGAIRRPDAPSRAPG
jgi:AcrR family transcriptional regulator